MIKEEQNNYFEEIISKLCKVSGLDYIYFLDNNSNILIEKPLKGANNYLEQVVKIITTNSELDKVSTSLYSKEFHTLTLLNEQGLIVISKLTAPESFYLVIIGGETEPVDLISLLKICKESRLGFENLLKTSA